MSKPNMGNEMFGPIRFSLCFLAGVWFLVGPISATVLTFSTPSRSELINHGQHVEKNLQDGHLYEKGFGWTPNVTATYGDGVERTFGFESRNFGNLDAPHIRTSDGIIDVTLSASANNGEWDVVLQSLKIAAYRYDDALEAAYLAVFDLTSDRFLESPIIAPSGDAHRLVNFGMGIRAKELQIVLDTGTGTEDIVLDDLTFYQVPTGFGLGDADKNHIVDLADFSSLKESFGRIFLMHSWDRGDFNSDRLVDLEDFNTLKAHFGETTVPAAAAVPEPSGLMLAVVAFLSSPFFVRAILIRAIWLTLLVMVALSPPLLAAIDDALVAYWPFDGNFSEEINGLNGSPRGSTPIAFESAKFGQGIRLNGENQYVEVTGGHASSLDFVGSDLSISVWFTVDAFDTTWQTLIAKGEQFGWRIHRREDENRLSYSGGGSGTPGNTANSPDVYDGQFHHLLAVTEHGVSQRLWVDGQLVETYRSPDIQLPRVNNRVRIGDNPSTMNREWEGFIDDVGIWNRTLTVEEILEIWNGGSGKSLGSLVNPRIDGDLNADGVVDSTDITLLRGNIGGNARIFDLNSDGFVTPSDVDHLITVILQTVRGDANLDRRVDLQDFSILKGSFGNQNLGWGHGDFDGNDFVGLDDFGILKLNFGFNNTADAVPEPSSLGVAVIAAASLLLYRFLPSCRNRHAR